MPSCVATNEAGPAGSICPLWLSKAGDPVALHRPTMRLGGTPKYWQSMWSSISVFAIMLQVELALPTTVDAADLADFGACVPSTLRLYYLAFFCCHTDLQRPDETTCVVFVFQKGRTANPQMKSRKL